MSMPGFMQKAPSPLNATTLRSVPSAIPAANSEARLMEASRLNTRSLWRVISHQSSEQLPADVMIISSRRRLANRRKHSAKSMSGLAAQHIASESDHNRPCHHAAVPERGGEPRNVSAALNRHKRNVDRPNDGLQIKPVRLVEFGRVAKPAAQCNAYEEWNLI